MTQQQPILLLAPHRSPWFSLSFVFSLVILGAFVGQLIGTKLAFTGTEPVALTDTALPLRQPLLILQAVTASCAFIGAPLLYLRFFAYQDIRGLFPWSKRYITPMLLTLGLVLAFMVVDIWLVQWNRAVKLPPWLRAFELWAQEKEAALQRLTALLTTFRSLTDLGVGIVVIGIIPAVGEELLFRGIIQNLCHRLTHNIHGAIFVSAFVFSAVHLQFYGFVPRFLLGALFGYLYWWTSDLAFPMVAHFFNNAFTLLMLFLHQQGIIAYDITAPAVPAKAVLSFFALVVVVLGYFLRQLTQKRNT